MNDKQFKKTICRVYVFSILSILIIGAAFIVFAIMNCRTSRASEFIETDYTSKKVLIAEIAALPPVDMREDNTNTSEEDSIEGIFMVVEASQEIVLTDEELKDAEHLAKAVFGEARNCSKVEQAAVIWCILNRVDSDDPYYPDTIMGVLTQSGQIRGYRESNPVDSEIYELAIDVLMRWQKEKLGVEDVGRVLPVDYLFFAGDGVHNYFRKTYKGYKEIWDFSLPNPYED